MVTADFVISHATQLVTCAGPAPRRGPAQRTVESIRDGAVASFQGRIVFVGPTDDMRRRVRTAPSTKTIDANGCVVVPGFVDPHTHAMYAGDRRGELRRRLSGATYAEIAAEGGGIAASVKQ